MYQKFIHHAVVLSLVIACAHSPSASNTAPQIISLKNGFVSYLDPSKPDKEKLAQEFFNKHEEIFKNLVYPELSGDLAKINQRLDRLDNFLKENPENFNKVISSFERIELAASAHVEKFKETFPNANYEYEIYFLPSLLWIAGRASIVSDKNVVVAFGVDTIAKNNEDISILYPHEMFHALHFKTLNLNQKEQRAYEEDLLASLWFEGFASYVSALMANVETSPTAIFGKIGKNSESDKDMIIKSYMSDLNTVSNSNESMMDKWFGSGNDELKIPPMAGYCIGLWMVKKLLERHTIGELLLWYPKNKRVEIANAVKDLI